MIRQTQISIPTLVRIKTGALDRLGLYASRHQFLRVVWLHSADLDPALLRRVAASLEQAGVAVERRIPVQSAELEMAQQLFAELPGTAQALIAVGGGKALDVAKYIAFLARLPYVAAPTSLSNDGFCSPQSSLTIGGHRKSLPAAMPYGIVLDTEVCLQAPVILWLSGVGDLVAKLTAVEDWRLAFQAAGTPVDDFAALLSDATVFQFLARPQRDLEGIRLLGTALMLNGIAMEVCGSSRPTSGSEHLISHALDRVSARPRLHGLQVGVATYVAAGLQRRNVERIGAVFETTGFWRALAADPLSAAEWEQALRLAPSIKPGYYTVLSSRDCVGEALALMRSDERLRACFIF